jgi:hypothetical protein
MIFLLTSPLRTPASTAPMLQPWVIEECEKFDGMRIGRGYQSSQRKSARAPFRPSRMTSSGGEPRPTRCDTDN